MNNLQAKYGQENYAALQEVANNIFNLLNEHKVLRSSDRRFIQVGADRIRIGEKNRNSELIIKTNKDAIYEYHISPSADITAYFNNKIAPVREHFLPADKLLAVLEKIHSSLQARSEIKVKVAREIPDYRGHSECKIHLPVEWERLGIK